MKTKMTKRGYDAIVAEIDYRWSTERPIVVEEVHQAALLGDRSENAAYIYGKQRLRKIDSRIQYLKRKILFLSRALDQLEHDLEMGIAKFEEELASAGKSLHKKLSGVKKKIASPITMIMPGIRAAYGCLYSCKYPEYIEM